MKIAQASSFLFKSCFREKVSHDFLKRFLSNSQSNLARKRIQGFVDYLAATARAGNGGDGAVMFTSDFMREYCGPDGGNGGHGAHIVLRATNSAHSLSGISSTIQGRSGEAGASKGCAGKSADHIFVDVPIGTVVYEINENSSHQKLLGDLSHDGDFLVVARGGAGGRGNQAFLTNEQRAPAFAEKGGQGEERRIAIEMKLIADFGLIGMPNAGKSSLLNALSRARPKVASYPFTTLKPHIGIIELEDARQISVADLPGIIEGAHENRGLGLAFLRHIERCRGLLYILDLSCENPDPICQFELLRAELQNYNPDLVKMRQSAIVANKIDIPQSGHNLEKLRRHCTSSSRLPVVAISAKFGANLSELKHEIVKMFSCEHEKTPKISQIVE